MHRFWKTFWIQKTTASKKIARLCFSGIMSSYISGGNLNEDFCGVEPVTHPPEPVETRPPPDVDLQRELDLNKTDEAILGSECLHQH